MLHDNYSLIAILVWTCGGSLWKCKENFFWYYFLTVFGLFVKVRLVIARHAYYRSGGVAKAVHMAYSDYIVNLLDSGW